MYAQLSSSEHLLIFHVNFILFLKQSLIFLFVKGEF